MIQEEQDANHDRRWVEWNPILVSGDGERAKSERDDVESLLIRTCPDLMVHISQLETRVVRA